MVRCDVLKKDGNAWQIIEAKSSTVSPYKKDPKDSLQNLAIQKYVLTGCGLSISKTQLMLINSKDCYYPDLSNLFAIEDVSDEVEWLIDSMHDTVEEFKTIVNKDEEPQVAMGKHCEKPYPCPLKDYCKQSAPKDISIKSGEPSIDNKAIQASLAQLEYPIHFLDFETDDPAIPRHEGMRPYQKFPFQYSCHVLNADGNLTHYEYLHTDASDPRQDLAESMLNAISSRGSVVAYYASFEKGILEHLASVFPQHESRLQSIISRLWDQLEIFRKHYKHPDFNGSNSLKNVLPVLVPSMSYDGLNVQDGLMAQAIWNQLLKTKNESERTKLIADLKTYCKQDTLAMVEIHRVLSRDRV